MDDDNELITGVQRLVDEGRLVGADIVSVATAGGDAGADFRVVTSDGAYHAVQVKTWGNGSKTYTMTTVELQTTNSPDGQDKVGEAFARTVRRFSVDRHVPGAAAAGVLRLAALMLPGSARERWLEEWRGELYDLRADDAPWWRRTAYVVDLVLRGAPHQAVILRWQGRRAVD